MLIFLLFNVKLKEQAIPNGPAGEKDVVPCASTVKKPELPRSEWLGRSTSCVSSIEEHRGHIIKYIRIHKRLNYMMISRKIIKYDSKLAGRSKSTS